MEGVFIGGLDFGMYDMIIILFDVVIMGFFVLDLLDD